MNLLTIQEAAERLESSTSRVRLLILSGRLKAEKSGNVYVINEEDLALFERRAPDVQSTSKEVLEKIEAIIAPFGEKFGLDIKRSSDGQYPVDGELFWYNVPGTARIHFVANFEVPVYSDEINANGIQDGTKTEEDFQAELESAIQKLLHEARDAPDDASAAPS